MEISTLFAFLMRSSISTQKYKAMLKENPDMEINWPFFNVVKEAIRMLNSLKTGESQIDFDHYESSEDDKGSDMDQNGEDEAKNENKENDHINVFESRIKEEIIGDEDADSDHHAAANLSQHRACMIYLCGFW